METVGGDVHIRNCKWTDGRPGVKHKNDPSGMTPCIDYCSTETVYAVPVYIPVCVLVQPIYTVYVRSGFFSADTTASCTE